MIDLRAATPAEVDTPLAALMEKIADLDWERTRLISRIESAKTRLAKDPAPWYAESRQASIDDWKAKVAAVDAKIEAAAVEAIPYQQEFTRRGGWTRAWLVDNRDGHVHNTMSCSTCFPTTRFGWLPQVSGLPEEEIVALAGEKACTICYPTAPAEVLNNPSALELPKRREERLAREAETAAKAAAKAVKSLSLDGSKVDVGWSYESKNWRTGETVQRRRSKELKTYRAAELFVIGALAGTLYADETPPPEVVDVVLALMAQKRNVTVEEMRASLEPRVEKARRRREAS